MTTRRTLPNFDSTSTKQEEIDALFAIAECFKPGTYLADFFTTGLLNWLESTIRDDFSPDLMAAIRTAEANNTDLRNQLQEYQQRLEAEKRARQADNLEREQEIDQRNKRIQELNDKVTYWYDLAHETELTRQELADTNESLKTEIISLKARLWDLAQK